MQPTTVGPYRILELVGQGGMGSVYEAEHQDAQRRAEQGVVAVKVMHPHLAASPGFLERFAREGRVGLSLDHPGISTVIEVIDEPPAIVMERIHGRHLGAFLGAPLPAGDVVGLLRQVGDALSHAHERGVVHRDLKPENVLLTPQGRAVLLDFGIAKVAGDGHTRTGTGMGSVATMAPEQYRDAKRVDARADVYALAMLGTWMLAGRPPWKPGLPEFELLTLKAAGELTPLAEMVGGLPQGLDAALAAGLTPDPEQRLPSVEALLTLLEHAVSPTAGETFVFEGSDLENENELGNESELDNEIESELDNENENELDNENENELEKPRGRWPWVAAGGGALMLGLLALFSIPGGSEGPVLQEHGVQLVTIPATPDTPGVTAARSALPTSLAEALEVDCADCGSWLEVGSQREAMELCNLLSDREELEPAYFLTGSSALLAPQASGFRLPTVAELELLESVASASGLTPPESAWTQDGPEQGRAAVWLVRD